MYVLRTLYVCMNVCYTEKATTACRLLLSAMPAGIVNKGALEACRAFSRVHTQRTLARLHVPHIPKGHQWPHAIREGLPCRPSAAVASRL